MKKVMVVFGTRPEAIKLAPLIYKLKENDHLETTVCVTGQHREMLDQVLDVFKIRPDFDLSIMRENQTLTELSRNLLISLEEVFIKDKPDLVLVHGDTTSAFTASLVSFYLQIPVGHVEAGLRTNDLNAPFPEEFNRQAIDIVSQYYFVPTELSKQNLLLENKDAKKIFVTGNTAIDALKYTVKKDFKHELLDWLGNDRLILLTTHRRENLGDPMRSIFRALNKIIQETNDVKVIFPIHLNPKIRLIANEIIGHNERIKIVEPFNVVEFHNFISRSFIILTDSGGIQEEAPSFGVPVLVLRDTTERPEGIIAGNLKLVGTSEDNIIQECLTLIRDKGEYAKYQNIKNPFGDGFASEKIVNIISGE